MYELELSEALCLAQEDMAIKETSIGQLLRDVALGRPQAEALVEVTQTGDVARRWTYAELFEDSEKLALALASRFKPGKPAAPGRRQSRIRLYRQPSIFTRQLCALGP